MKLLKNFYNESPTKTRTRDRIVQTAIDLFSYSGMESVTLTDIAEKCEITLRNLYRYYPSKEYLVVDATYELFQSLNFDNILQFNDSMTGYDMLEHLLKYIYDLEKSSQLGLKFIRFIMYFDLYISKLDATNGAYIKYVEDYRPELNEPGIKEMGTILKKGIKDGSINIANDEIEFYVHYLTQTLMSVVMRTIVKEAENPSINGQLVDKQIEVMLYYIKRRD